MTDRQRRIEKLVMDIGSALDRGVSAERIHAELIRRRMPPDKAVLLMDRILAARARSVGPVAALAPPPPPHETLQDDAVPALRRGRYRRTPIFLAIASMLVAGGFTGLYRSSQASAERRALELATEAARLDAEVVHARDHLAHIDARIEERRVDAEQIEWLRARVARGPASFASPEDYQAMVGIYDRRRTRWNRTLPEYQIVSQAFRTLAEIHNAKLDSLNAVRRLVPAVAVPARDSVRHARITAVAFGR